MNAQTPNNFAHSAIVDMELRLHDQVLPIAQLGPDFLILVTPTDHPPADGHIWLSIDGRVKEWPVRLEEGMAVSRRRTRIAPLRLVTEERRETAVIIP